MINIRNYVKEVTNKLVATDAILLVLVKEKNLNYY